MRGPEALGGPYCERESTTGATGERQGPSEESCSYGIAWPRVARTVATTGRGTTSSACATGGEGRAARLHCRLTFGGSSKPARNQCNLRDSAVVPPGTPRFARRIAVPRGEARDGRLLLATRHVLVDLGVHGSTVPVTSGVGNMYRDMYRPCA